MAKHTDMQQLRTAVYHIVSQIPSGAVLTYGDLARLAGQPNHSRQIGRLMAAAPALLHLPCHRVVSAEGRLAPHWPEQSRLLAAEGVKVKTNSKGEKHIDLKIYRWKILGEQAF